MLESLLKKVAAVKAHKDHQVSYLSTFILSNPGNKKKIVKQSLFNHLLNLCNHFGKNFVFQCEKMILSNWKTGHGYVDFIKVNKPFYFCFKLQISSIIQLASPFDDQCSYHIETSQLVCRANQLSGLYMVGTLVVKGLRNSPRRCSVQKVPLNKNFAEFTENTCIGASWCSAVNFE